MTWTIEFAPEAEKSLHGKGTATWTEGEEVFSFSERMYADEKGITNFKARAIAARDQWAFSLTKDATIALAIKTAIDATDAKVVK